VRGNQNEAWRRRYAAHPRAFEAQLRNALPAMAFVLENVEQRDLPGEFVLIPLIESGYRANARGLGGPLGLWQMIPSTARNHGLRVERGHDARLSVEDSTKAALSYLSTLHTEFGEWRATAMAYNAGEGRLRRAFARAGKAQVSGERRLPAGMSGITYAYVAKLHALACLIAAPQRHGLSLPTDAFTPLGAAAATESSGSSLPTAASTESASSSAERTHRVQAGETLWRISRRYGVSLDALLRANGLRKDGVLRIGQDLRIPN
jgi:membrane-bound lytic murein transglycosylase D